MVARRADLNLRRQSRGIYSPSLFSITADLLMTLRRHTRAFYGGTSPSPNSPFNDIGAQI